MLDTLADKAIDQLTNQPLPTPYQRMVARADKRRPKLKTDKEIGVWVDGNLTPRLTTRDRQKADEYAAKMMRERHSVWVAPVGSFVTAERGGR